MTSPKHHWPLFIVFSLFVTAGAGAQDQTSSQRSAVDDFASTLVATKTAAEREQLLDDHKDLVTVELRKALTKLGNNLADQKNLSLALDTFRLVQTVSERINDKTGVASALNSIGNVLRDQGKRVEALEAHQKGLGLSEEMGDKDMMARILGTLGVDYHDLDKNEEALGYFNQSLKIATDTANKEVMATALGNLGELAFIKGQYQLAIEYDRKALAEQEALENKEGIVNNLNSLGIVYATLGNLDDALIFFQKSLALVREDASRASRLMYNIGNINTIKGDYVQAMEWYQKSLANGGAGGALVNIADLYFQQGDYLQAQAYYDKTLELWGPGYGRTYVLEGVAKVNQARGDYGKAIEYYTDALKQYEMADRKSGMGSTLRGIAECLLLQQKETEAHEYYRRSLKVFEETGDPAELSNTLLAIAKYYLRKKDYSQALEYARRSAKGSKQNSWEANTVLGQVYGALNEPARARQSFMDAIASIENARLMVAGGEEQKQRFMEGRVLPYQEMISLLIAAGNTNEAFSLAERSKGRVLLDVLQGDKINLSKTMTAQEQTEEQRLNNELVSLNAQIAAESNRAKPSQEKLAALHEDLEKARLSYAAFRNQLYIAHPNLKTQRGETQPLTLDEAANLLPDEKTGLLEYVVTPDRTYLFVVIKGAPEASAELKVYPIEIGQKELEQRVGAYRQKIARADLDFRSSAQALYDLLLKPAQAQLKGSTSLVIVPDSVLWDLPFQALQSSAQRYLIEDQAISYAPSLTVLREIVKSHKLPRSSGSPTTLLAFGNPIVSKQTADRVKPVFMDEALEPLPEAERQVTELAKLYGKQARAYTGAQAREGRAKAEASAFRILQFATHGVLNSASPMYSHLVLSPGDDAKEDGLLEAWEIMNLDLHADMVVLAACETARGRVGAGEGMIGMSWAFFIAGSPTTVASQWKVESASTSKLMLAFHRNLKSHLDAKGAKVSKARALQLASIKLLKSPQYQHPFYWGAFVLIGDGF